LAFTSEENEQSISDIGSWHESTLCIWQKRTSSNNEKRHHQLASLSVFVYNWWTSHICYWYQWKFFKDFLCH